MHTLRTSYNGQTFYYPKNSMIGECIAAGDGWDRPLVPVLKHFFAGSQPTIVEVGTNIAGSLLQMESAVPQATFYCFEPAERFFWYAQRNIDENKWGNVTLEKMFLSDKEETVQLNINASTASAAIDEYRESIRTLQPLGKQKTRSTKLDTYFDGKKIDFLKIDTDGYERKVIGGGQQIIKESHPVIFIEFDPRMMEQAGQNPHELLDLLGSLGYTRFLVLSNFGETLGVEESHERIVKLGLHNPYYVDLLCVDSNNPQIHTLETLAKHIGNKYTTYPSHVERPT